MSPRSHGAGRDTDNFVVNVISSSPGVLDTGCSVLVLWIALVLLTMVPTP